MWLDGVIDVAGDVIPCVSKIKARGYYGQLLNSWSYLSFQQI